MKSGQCRFGAKCYKNHPEEISTGTDHHDQRKGVKRKSDENETGRSTPEVSLNSMGLPSRYGAEVCSFYQRNGQCKYGKECYKDHPESTEKINLKTKTRIKIPKTGNTHPKNHLQI